MINTTLDQIRGVCRSICLIFMRQENPPIDPQTRRKPVGINFLEEVSFFLNNLDCKYT